MAEERDSEAHADVSELLEEWREAERAVGAAPGDELARHRADDARREYHDAEDEEREAQGDHRARRQPG